MKYIHAMKYIDVIYLYIYILCLSVCFFVCIQKTSKRLNRPAKFFCGTSHDPREGIDDQNFKKFVSNKMRLSLNFKNPRMLFL